MDGELADGSAAEFKPEAVFIENECRFFIELPVVIINVRWQFLPLNGLVVVSVFFVVIVDLGSS